VADTKKRRSELDEDPGWHKDAIVYQLHVKTFCDSNGDGIGDFKGLTEKLDYLQDLGVTAIWLLPFCPSPLKDDGYDISDYGSVHPAYGTLRDFKVFLREAHARGLRVITELVVNHTSDQHPWFQRARRAKPGSSWRDFYVWSDTPDRYRGTRIIFQDFESSNWAWDPVAKAYYWHRFYSHQPDLNYDNPKVRSAILKVLDFWFDLGVDGLRLDAVPYLYEREGTNCENLPETHQFLKQMRAHVDSRFENRILLGEANQWPEDAVDYFGVGDECHMAFHFPLMPRLFMALWMEDRFPIIDILEQTPLIPEVCQWAVFLRNHDELTLEMVTDEERDYMHRVYAHDPQMRINLGIRRRLAPLLNNSRRRIELMTCLLFAMPGTPIMYYGDEIGMGDNVYLGDRNGVRTPMQWSADRNAGFSRANPQKLYLPVIINPEYHCEVVNVEAQRENTSSLLWWNKRIVALRKRFKAFSRGTIQFLHPENHRVLTFVRRHENEDVLVVANLSRFAQFVELDLSAFQGLTPTEVFGQTAFPVITDSPYFLSLGPHSFYWLELSPQPADLVQASPEVPSPLPVLNVDGNWQDLMSGKARSALEKILPGYLRVNRWFGGKARRIKSVRLREGLFMPAEESTEVYMVPAQVEYADGDGETYVLVFSFASGVAAEKIIHEHPLAVVARCETKAGTGAGILHDAFVLERFCKKLLEQMLRPQRRKGFGGTLVTSITKGRGSVLKSIDGQLEATVLKGEQTNTSVVYGKQFVLKFFRRLQPGVNPDLEMGRYLTRKGFAHLPPVLSALEYVEGGEAPMTMATLQGFVQNQGDAWGYTLGALDHYFEHVLVRRSDSTPDPVCEGSPLRLVGEEIPPEASERIGPYLEAVRLLGQRTGEMHLLLSSATDESSFAPEPFSKLYQRALYQSMRTLTGKVVQLLRRQAKSLPEGAREAAHRVIDQKEQILKVFQSIMHHNVSAMRTRCHGDYHLGQVLYTGKDFVMIDFEGEPARPISERRIKRSPLRDVAGMLRSFHYATHSALTTQEARGMTTMEATPYLEKMARFWQIWVSVAFLKGYLEVAHQGSFLPREEDELRVLLDIYVLEKAVYELGYELNNRPGWVKIPLEGIEQILASLE